MEFLVSAYHLIVGLPQWAWGALGVLTVISVVWLIVDFLSFLIVSFFAIVVGVLTFMFGWNYLQHML